MVTERTSRRRPGVLKPTAELRKALDEAETCIQFFEAGNFMDWFQSINEIYLENSGKIDGPKIYLGSKLDDTAESEESDLFEMKAAEGRIATSIKWADIQDTNSTDRVISMSLSHESRYGSLYMSLYAAADNKQSNSNMVTGTSVQRDFRLNPESGLSKYVDDLLLTFTNELFDLGIL